MNWCVESNLHCQNKATLDFMSSKLGLPIILFCTLIICCAPANNQENKEMNSNATLSSVAVFDIQGHRGCRGLMPENSIPGFLKALDIGVTTLELDVVITADRKVICSHEPWFSHTLAHDPQGHLIKEEDEQNHSIYKMTFAQTQEYECGMRPHPNFPEQVKTPVHKPLLSKVIAEADSHAIQTNRPLPKFNIETKTTIEGDGVFHPSPAFFSDLLYQVISDANALDRTTIQSFDVRTLQHIKANYPKVSLALLIESEGLPEIHIEKLGFYPDIYSPYYLLVDQELVDFCQRHQMKLIPWTVNEDWEMEKLISLGVDGIITDYPDRLTAITNKKK